MSKRLILAKTAAATGMLRLLEMRRSKPGIFIVNHHRIGYAASSRFDREVFSATPEELDTQLTYLKKLGPVVSGDELSHLVGSHQPLKHFYIFITFDDGYLDNYSSALDILRSQGCSAAFFLVPLFVGSNIVPWWDEIAFLVRNTTRPKISLRTPVPFEISITDNRGAAIHAVLGHYKRVDNRDGNRFMAELRSQVDCSVPAVSRRFLNWDEAREMQRNGMTIGSQTATHPILSHLSPEEQLVELKQSKSEIEAQLNTEVSTLAYPVGTPTAFTKTTQKIAQSLGYRQCFSFYGGINTNENMNPTDLRRFSLTTEPSLFRFEALAQAKLGRLPY